MPERVRPARASPFPGPRFAELFLGPFVESLNRSVVPLFHIAEEVMAASRSRRHVLVEGLALASLGLVAGLSAPALARPDERHPHIRAAIRELREARKELEKADHDFGGHRVEAIKAIDHAIKQLEKALEYDRR
jgi:hypothetical protein